MALYFFYDIYLKKKLYLGVYKMSDDYKNKNGHCSQFLLWD